MYLPVKGHLISKGLLVSSILPKNLTMIPQVDLFSFFGRISRRPKDISKLTEFN